MSDELVDRIRAAVLDVVQDELRKFRDAEIAPLQQQLLELRRAGEPLSRQRTPPVAPHPGSVSPGFLHRVSSKVLQTTTALFSLDDIPPLDDTGPVTIRRNSGVSRLAEQPHEALTDFSVPRLLLEGVSIIRITHNKKVQRLLKLDSGLGMLTWNTKPSSRLYIDRICEIYIGEDAKNYREEFGVSYEHSARWATIIHQRPNETKLRALHLVMSSKNDFDVFLKAIVELVRFRRELMCGLARAGSHFVDVHWKRTNMDTVGFHQVLQITRQMHIHCSVQHIRHVFELADRDKSDRLSFAEFKEFVRLLKHRADIDEVYRVHKIGESTANLLAFLAEVQLESLPPSIPLPLSSPLSLEEFSHLLLSTKPRVEPNLTLPLNNYFISSSHNTYLSGRQVADGSSVESCIRALQDGCRCLELDCWDGPEKRGSPVVYHGSSVARLTTSVVFSDVIESILKYAFISSPYPLILSLEIRCNETSQLQIVSILKSVFGSLLVTQPISDTTQLPSPEALKHRILIKVKSEEENDGAESSESSEYGDGSDSSVTSLVVRSDKPKHKVIPVLAELGVYFSGRKFETFDVKPKYNTVYSFNERTVRKMHPQKLAALKEYDELHLSRVYPAPTRISSSNFDPIYFWKRGIQMVALNWQKWDLGMQLNSAFFPSKIGYTLKPELLRPGGKRLSSPAPLLVKIKIISAQQLTRPKFLKEDDVFSPYVIAQAFGVEDLDSQLAPQWRTMSVFNNGFNPIWNFEFEIKLRPEDFDFVCVRFSVATESHVFALCTLRVVTMPKGYQHFPLQDTFGEDYIFSSLFIKTSVTSVVETT